MDINFLIFSFFMQFNFMYNVTYWRSFVLIITTSVGMHIIWLQDIPTVISFILFLLFIYLLLFVLFFDNIERHILLILLISQVTGLIHIFKLSFLINTRWHLHLDHGQNIAYKQRLKDICF